MLLHSVINTIYVKLYDIYWVAVGLLRRLYLIIKIKLAFSKVNFVNISKIL